MAIHNVPGPEPQRGYQAVGVEKTATLNNPNGEVNYEMLSHEGREDVKETFDMGGAADREYPNMWPDEAALPGFRAWMERYYAAAHDIVLQLLAALEMALEIPAGELVRRSDGYRSEMRMNHYPATPVATLQAANTMRIWPHTDASSITLLVQDGNGGLEVEDQHRPGVFVPLLRDGEAEFIVNGGETLERWTNGRLKPGLHQVSLPPHLKDQTTGTLPSRRSVAFFANANQDASMAPLPQFVDGAVGPKFEDMTSREYHRFRNAVVY